MLIVCDECHNEFDLDKGDIKHKALDSILVNVKYFECKHCGHKYVMDCVDQYILKEQKRYKSIKDHKKKMNCLNNMKTHSDRLKLKVIKLL